MAAFGGKMIKRYMFPAFCIVLAIALFADAKTTPDFSPVSEELSPLKTRIVSISARSTPLRDVLYVVAKGPRPKLLPQKRH